MDKELHAWRVEFGISDAAYVGLAQILDRYLPLRVPRGVETRMTMQHFPSGPYTRGRKAKRSAPPSLHDTADHEVVSRLLTCVLDGAGLFMKNKAAQLRWNDDIEKLRPKRASSSGADRTVTFVHYAQATGIRSWQAEFLLGCSLINDLYRSERPKLPHERTYKSLARCVISLLNSLYSHIGGDAFKVIPALSASYNTSQAKSPIGQMPNVNSVWLGSQLASKLLLHPDQSWRSIDLVFTFDPAEILQLSNQTLDQTRCSIGLSAQLGRLSVETPAIFQQPPLPAMLPYDSPIFVCVQKGDVHHTRELLYSGSAHINTVDPYGLSLAYYAAYYCCRAHGIHASCAMYSALIAMGVDAQWTDEIGNAAQDTLIDSALMHLAMGRGTEMDCLGVVSSLHRYDDASCDFLLGYSHARTFSPVHRALLNLDKLQSPLEARLDAAIKQCPVDNVDISGRSPLAWAVEYRYLDGVRALLDRGGSASFIRTSVSRSVAMPLLHLLLAGPTDDTDVLLAIVDALVFAGADVMATDDEGWTSLHVAASWDMFAVSRSLLSSGDRGHLIMAKTHKGETAYDLAYAAKGGENLLLLLGGGGHLDSTWQMIV